jgi:hypothetical protein
MDHPLRGIADGKVLENMPKKSTVRAGLTSDGVAGPQPKRSRPSKNLGREHWGVTGKNLQVLS